MRALAAFTIIAAIVVLGTMVPKLSLLPGTGFHPKFEMSISLSL